MHAKTSQTLLVLFAEADFLFQCNLLEESPEAVKRREEKMSMYQACKAALDIIGDCNMNLSSKTSTNAREKPFIVKPPPPSAAAKKSKMFYISHTCFYMKRFGREDFRIFCKTFMEFAEDLKFNTEVKQSKNDI